MPLRGCRGGGADALTMGSLPLVRVGQPLGRRLPRFSAPTPMLDLSLKGVHWPFPLLQPNACCLRSPVSECKRRVKCTAEALTSEERQAQLFISWLTHPTEAAELSHPAAL